MSSVLLGISKYEKILEDIAEACGEGKAKKKEAESKDEFIRTKKAIYQMLTTLRTNIRERQAHQKRHGNSHESIERGLRIREQIKQLEKTLPKLQEVHRKQQQKTLFKNKKLTVEEIEERFQDIRIVKRQLEEAKQWFAQGNAPDLAAEEGGGLGLGDADLRIELFGSKAEGSGAAGVAAVDKSGRGLNEDESTAMDRWKQKDAEFDQLLDEIGDIADRLNPLAQKIGAAAERQSIMAQEVIRKTDKAEADVRNLNVRIRNVMNYQKNTTFFCQLMLGIALLTGFGYAYAKLKDV